MKEPRNETPMAFGLLVITVVSIVLTYFIGQTLGTTIGIISGVVIWVSGFCLVILPQILFLRELMKPDDKITERSTE